MKELIIYDNEGFVITRIGGQPTPRKPVGVPYIYEEIPKDKQVKCVDVTKTPHELILENIPPTESEKLKADLDYLAIMTGVEL